MCIIVPMYIERVPNRNSPPCTLLRESYRSGGKVKKRTLANLSKWPEQIVAQLQIILRGGHAVEKIEESFDIVRTRPHGHVASVLGTLRKLGLHRIIASRRCRNRDLVEAMITSRIIKPRSKLATARGISEATESSSLSQALDLPNVDQNELYQAMDWLLSRQDRIEAALAREHVCDGSLVLYDVPS